MHGATLLYVGLEAFMIWRLSTSESPATQDSIVANKPKVVVGNFIQVVCASPDGASDLEGKTEPPASEDPIEAKKASDSPVVEGDPQVCPTSQEPVIVKVPHVPHESEEPCVDLETGEKTEM